MIKVYIEVEGGAVINVWSRDQDFHVVIIDHDNEGYDELLPDLLTDDVEESLNQKMGDYLEQEEAEDWEEDEDEDEDEDA